MLNEKAKRFLEKQCKLYIILLFIFSVIGLVSLLYNQVIFFCISIFILVILGFLVNHFCIVRIKYMIGILAMSIFIVPVIIELQSNFKVKVIQCILYLIFELFVSICIGGVLAIAIKLAIKFKNWQSERQREKIGRNFFKYLIRHNWSSSRCHEMLNFYSKGENSNFGVLEQYLKLHFTEINNYELYKKIKVSFSSFDINELKEISNYLDIVITLGEPDVKRSTEFLEIFKFINIFISAGISFKLQVVFKQLLKGIPFFIIAIIVYFSLIFLAIICGSIYNKIGKRKDIKMAKVLKNIINNILKERRV